MKAERKLDKSEINVLNSDDKKHDSSSKTISKIAKFHHFSQEISSISDIDELLEKTINFVMSVTDCEKSAIMLCNPSSNQLILSAQRNNNDSDVEFLSKEINDPELITLVSTKKNLHQNNGPSSIKSGNYVYTPIVYNEYVKGILEIQRINDRENLSEIDEHYLMTAANYIAINLDRIDKSNSTINKENILFRFQHIAQKALTLSTKSTENEILNSFVKEASEDLDADIITLFKYDKKRNQYTLPPYFFGEVYHPGPLQEPGIMHNESIVLKIIEHGKSFYASDANIDWYKAGLSRFRSEESGIENFIEREEILSSAGIILRSDDSIFGVMFINYRKYKVFSDDDIEIIELFGKQAAIVLQQARNFERQREELKTITNISNKLLTAQDRRKILEDIVSGAIELTNTTTGVIYLLSDDGKTVVDKFHPENFTHPEPRLSEDDSYTNEVFTNGEVVIVHDLSENNRAHPYLRENFCSLIAVPLLINKIVIGVLFLDDEKPHDFNETEVSLLLALVSQAALVIEQMQIQNELAFLSDISLSIINCENSSTLLDEISEKATNILQASGCAILNYYYQENKLRTIANHNLDILKTIEFDVKHGVFTESINSQEMQYLENYEKWPKELDIFRYPGNMITFNSIIIAPIVWRKAVIGILLIADNKANQIIARETTDNRVIKKGISELLKSISNLIAFAIGNSREQNYLQELVDISQDAIIAVNKNGEITQFNKASESILSSSREKIIGTNISKLYWDGIEEARKVNIELKNNKNLGIKNRYTFLKSEYGEKLPINLSGKLLLDERNEIIGSFGILTDLRENEELLERRRKSDFLADLEKFPKNINVDSFEILSSTLTTMLEEICEFCKIEYCIIFASKQENDTVLQAVAHAKLPDEVSKNLPHYNWRKAGFFPGNVTNGENLEYEAYIITNWQNNKEFIQNGVKGQMNSFFFNAQYMEPFRLADSYRSVILFGPDLENTNKDFEFFKNIALTIGTYALSWLQTLYLRLKQKESDLISDLITHRTLMNLSELTGRFGAIKRIVDKQSDIYNIAQDGEEIIQILAKSSRRALKSGVLDLGEQDYKFYQYSLATIVQNCVDSWIETAMKKMVDFLIDPSIERLPYANIDPMKLRIAISNIIDNAIKYCNSNSYIHILSSYDTTKACITIIDIGYDMPDSVRQNFRKPGKRYNTSKEARKIMGSGLGFWEANQIIQAHGGSIDFVSKKHSNNSNTFKVTVTITIKLKNKQSKITRGGYYG